MVLSPELTTFVGGAEMPFVQIIEYETDRADEIDAKMRQGMEQATSMPTFTHLTHTQDKDKPNHYLTIVEFPSYEAAMENSHSPETDAMAKELTALCTSGPVYYNLDVKLSMP
jgi:hypothetical protein